MCLSVLSTTRLNACLTNWTNCLKPMSLFHSITAYIGQSIAETAKCPARQIRLCPVVLKRLRTICPISSYSATNRASDWSKGWPMLHNIARRCTMQHDLVAPMDFWRNTTPFFLVWRLSVRHGLAILEDNQPSWSLLTLVLFYNQNGVVESVP